MWLATVLTTACFSPEIPDGEIACGTGGCPEGMSCAADGLCYADPPGGGDAAPRVALAAAVLGGHDRVYAMCGGELREVWRDAEVRESRAVAWGDGDADGVLDLAFGDYDNVRVYRSDDGAFEQVLHLDLGVLVRDVAWADIDDDGDDELAVAAENAPLRVYRYDRHDRALWERWSSDAPINAFALDAAPADGQGREDLAVGVRGGAPIVYASHGQGLHHEWSGDLAEDAESVAWADVDGDGDADLAVGNEGQPVRIYANRGEWFELVWSSPEPRSAEVSWGDVDGDGDPDLAVGTGPGEPVLLYRNDPDGTYTLAWSSDELDDTEATAWADFDGDGDLDLAVANDRQPIRVYRNDGGALSLAWSSPGGDAVWDVGWGWWDGGCP